MWYISIVVFLFTIVFFYLLFKDLKKEDTWNKMYVGNFIYIGKYGYMLPHCRKKIVEKNDYTIKIQHIGKMSKDYFLNRVRFNNKLGEYFLTID